jgi:hypothetical protein
MADVIAHLSLCEETNTEIRWDLIHRIIYPDDNVDNLLMSSMPNEVSSMPNEVHANMDDCRSAVTEGNDDESRASWFSVYAEFDDCASSLTFRMDGDDVKVGKKSKRMSDLSVSSLDLQDKVLSNRVSELGMDHPEFPRPSLIPNADRHSSRNLLRHDPLLRKRVQALQASTHSNLGPGLSDSFCKKKIHNSELKRISSHGDGGSSLSMDRNRSNLMDIVDSMDKQEGGDEHAVRESIPSIYAEESASLLGDSDADA